MNGRAALIVLTWAGCLVSGCASDPLPIPPSPLEAAHSTPRVVSAGDVLEVGYYYNDEVQSGPYKVGVGDVLKVDVVEHPETGSQVNDLSTTRDPAKASRKVISTGDTLEVGYYLNDAVQPGPYRIGIGDVLKIDVLDHPELTRSEAGVLPDGTIPLNLVGTVSVAGKTPEEVSKEIAQRYAHEKIKDVRVVVSVIKGQQRLRLLTDPQGRGLESNRLELRIQDEPYLELPFIAPVEIGRPFAEIRREIKEAYKKEFADQLKVTVNLTNRLQQKLTREDVTVLPDGTISLNLVGSMFVAGKTPEDLSKDIANRYASQNIKDANIFVSLVKGQQRLKLLTDPQGKGVGSNKVELRVHDETYVELPFINPIAVGRTLTDIRMEIKNAYQKAFGDQLIVTVNFSNRLPQNIYVFGEVTKAGVFPIQEEVNLISALAMAGGMADSAFREQVLVIRFKNGGKYDYWSFNLKDPLPVTDSSATFRLQGNDVVYVAKSNIAKIDLWVDQYIRKTLPFYPNAGVFYALPVQ